MVMRGVRSLPLVGIVEFLMYGCSRYFRERHQDIVPHLSNPQMLFGPMMTTYMDKKSKKALEHHVVPTGTVEQRFEVFCKDRSCRGVRRERIIQECVLRDDGTCSCNCQKPRVLHRPCSHVLAASAECGIHPSCYVSRVRVGWNICADLTPTNVHPKSSAIGGEAWSAPDTAYPK